jgi:anti-sigma-K factor RskA
MTPDDDMDLERGGDDLLAAEYVLGVLPADQRQAAALRIEAEPEFARLVDAWELHLAPLGADFEPVEPPPALKAALDRRLFASTASPAAPAANGFWQRLAVWRALTFAAVAAAMLAVAVPLLTPAPVTGPEQRLAASLAAADSDVHYLALYDAGAGRISLSHVSGELAAGRDFELWIIEGDNAPVSLGVIPAGARVEIAAAEPVREAIGQGAVFAISLEPDGGSPTGAPTGPVVAAGEIRSI